LGEMLSLAIAVILLPSLAAGDSDPSKSLGEHDFKAYPDSGGDYKRAYQLPTMGPETCLPQGTQCDESVLTFETPACAGEINGVCTDAPGNDGAFMTPTAENPTDLACVDLADYDTCKNLLLEGKCVAPPGEPTQGTGKFLQAALDAGGGAAKSQNSADADKCPRACGLCSPIYVSPRGTFSGTRSDIVYELQDADRFLPLLERESCQPYDVSAVVAAVEKAMDDGLIDIAKAVRLGFHDAGDYSKWSGTGGPDGNVGSPPETEFGQSHGLNLAVAQARPVWQGLRNEGTMVSFADFVQISSMVGVAVSGGPSFDEFNFEPGRIDNSPRLIPPDGRIPNPFGTATTLRDVFYRMNLNDTDIVVLSGGHTLGGSASVSGSGFAKADFTETPDDFDTSYFQQLLKVIDVPSETLQADNCEQPDGTCILPTDAALVKEPAMLELVKQYASNQELFNRDYAASVKKLSELGRDISVRWCKYDGDGSSTNGGA